MAVTKQLSIGSSSHISNTLKYVIDDVKTENRLVSGLDCNPYTASTEFEFTKKMYKKKNGIKGHHVIQSFKPGEVKAEDAHELGQKLAKEIADGYQCVVVTHIDKKHIHNHIIINSVSYQNGKKYYADKSKLNQIRDISDKLCMENKLSIVKDKTYGNSLDQATYHIAQRGESWKVMIAKVLDEAIDSSSSKEEFIKYMNDMGYEVKWQNKNISILEPEHKKYVRTKRLGENYTKEMIEHRINNRGIQRGASITNRRSERTDVRSIENRINDIRESINNRERNSSLEEQRRMFKKFERREKISKIHNLNKVVDDDKREDDNLDQQIKVLRFIIAKAKQAKKVININDLKGGDNIQMNERLVKLNQSQVDKLLVNDGTEETKFKIALLKVSEDLYYASVDKNDIRYVYQKVGLLDRESKIPIDRNNISKHIKITKDEYIKLKDSDIKHIAYINKDNEVLVGINGKDTEALLKKINRTFEKQLGNISYAALKESGDVDFRIVDKKTIESLRQHKGAVKFAAFKKADGKYNLAFASKDREKVLGILRKSYERNKSR